MSSYAQLLRDPRWQRKRLEILSRDQWRCKWCGCSDSTLHVHHHFYIKGRAPWQYLNSALITLCHECHTASEEFEPLNGDEYNTWEHILDVGQAAGMGFFPFVGEGCLGTDRAELIEEIRRALDVIDDRWRAKGRYVSSVNGDASCQPAI